MRANLCLHGNFCCKRHVQGFGMWPRFARLGRKLDAAVERLLAC